MELIFPIAEYFAQPQSALALDFCKLGTFKELLDQLQEIGTRISEITLKLADTENIASESEHEQLKQSQEVTRLLLKRKLHRYLSLVRTVMRMVPPSGVKVLQTIGVTKKIDSLMLLADPNLMDKNITLEFLKYLGKLLHLQSYDASWANEFLQVSRLAAIISTKKLYGRGNNLLAGSVSGLLNEMTKHQNSKLQGLFVEKHKFELDVASEYLYGAQILLKSYNLFKSGGQTENQNESRPNLIIKSARVSRDQEGEGFDAVESEMPRSLLTPENGFHEEGFINSALAVETSATALDKIFKECEPAPSTPDSGAIFENSTSQPHGKSNGYLEDAESAAIFESFHKEFEQQTKKPKVRKLCSYDDSDSDDDMFGRGKDLSSPLSRKIINPAALDAEFEQRRRKSSEDADEVFPSRKKALEMFTRKVSADSNSHRSQDGSLENSPPPTQLKLELEFPIALQKRPFPFDDKDDEEFANGAAPRPFPGKAEPSN